MVIKTNRLILRQWRESDCEPFAQLNADSRVREFFMEKIGMSHDPNDDFDHPRIPEGHPLRRQVLYRIAKVTALDKKERDLKDLKDL